ncbi:CGNR zinc finger domain-containing protein [Plantactinospora soyae]|uniref:RNA-binding Zn ribbon-like protein n=1 Tax=Plantactinospora soyae TaxID=1544732 RepID=A0A927M5P4_9ACTN|nr:CGNR zinc finger domain-containing protein [Plantactinospora soyae]MBE1485918.1 putative RNA-binding Zn ribbon-like protein [Plantactinospora soyae]
MVTGATRTDREMAVPAAAVAVVDLLNSRPYANMPDKLDDPERVAQVLRPFGQEDGVPSAQRLDLVRAVRSDLLALVDAADPADAAGGWAAFSGRVSAVTFQQDFSVPGQVELRQVAGDPVVGRITQDVAALVGAGDWSRLRLCANDVCREVFYDTTRNRSRRWHSYEYCGNRTNVAAYRARVAGSGSTSVRQG